MPTYQYACTDCGHRFEQVQSFTDPSLTSCPECGGKLRKVYGSVGVVFKGSGFYRNDARAGEARKRTDGDAGSGGADKGSGSAASGPDTAAAAKTESPAKSESTATPKTSSNAGSLASSAPSAPSGSSTSSAPKKAATG